MATIVTTIRNPEVPAFIPELAVATAGNSSLFLRSPSMLAISPCVVELEAEDSDAEPLDEELDMEVVAEVSSEVSTEVVDETERVALDDTMELDDSSADVAFDDASVDADDDDSVVVSSPSPSGNSSQAHISVYSLSDTRVLVYEETIVSTVVSSVD